MQITVIAGLFESNYTSIFLTAGTNTIWSRYDQFRGYQPAIELLQNPSTVIEKLIFYGDSFKPNETTDISRHIASRFTNTLTEIHLKDTGDFLVSVTNQTFPNVVRFTLEYERLPDSSQIARIYPAVQALELYLDYLPRKYYDSNRAHAAELVSSMPQLQNLTVRGWTNSLLPSIEQNLRHLKKLNMIYLRQPTNQTFHFTSVRKLYLTLEKRSIGARDPIPFIFDGLETLSLTAFTFDDEIPEWIKRHVTLKSFWSYSRYTGAEANAVDRLTVALSGLPKLEYVYMKSFSCPNLTTILPRLRQTKKVELSLLSSEVKKVMKTMPANWSVVEVSPNGLATFVPIRKDEMNQI